MSTIATPFTTVVSSRENRHFFVSLCSLLLITVFFLEDMYIVFLPQAAYNYIPILKL